MLNLMIDLESFGLEDDAVITQIGCVAFDDNYSEISMFNQPVSIVDGLLNGFSITPSTLEFWGKELKKNSWSQDVVKDLFYSEVSCKDAADGLHRWLNKTFGDEQFGIWANGILFDINKADYFLKRFGFKALTERTRYNNVEDLRTLRKTTQRINKSGLEKVEKVLRAKYADNVHNAVFDCQYQIELLQACLSILETSNHFNTKGETE